MKLLTTAMRQGRKSSLHQAAPFVKPWNPCCAITFGPISKLKRSRFETALMMLPLRDFLKACKGIRASLQVRLHKYLYQCMLSDQRIVYQQGQWQQPSRVGMLASLWGFCQPLMRVSMICMNPSPATWSVHRLLAPLMITTAVVYWTRHDRLSEMFENIKASLTLVRNHRRSRHPLQSFNFLRSLLLRGNSVDLFCQCWDRLGFAPRVAI